MWHTGSLLVEVKKNFCTVANMQRLVFEAFFQTGLAELKAVMKIIKHLIDKASHDVVHTGQRLPKVTIPLKHGYTVKLGDSSDPDAVEILYRREDWVDLMLEKLGVSREISLVDDVPKKAPEEMFG